jgi:hypothetical protein
MASNYIRAGGGALTDIFTTAVCPRGTVFFKEGAAGPTGYVFLENAGADTFAAGDVCSVYDSSGYSYGKATTTDATEPAFSDGTTSRALVAGIALAALTTGTFGWFWFAGYGTHAITTDGNIAAFQELICADDAKVATPNTTAASAHHLAFGLALAADSSTTLSSAVLGGRGMFRWGQA